MALLMGAQRQQSEATQRAYETNTVIAQFYRVLTSLLETQNALRGFVLAGDPALEKAFQEASQRSEQEINQLQTLVAGDPDNEQRVRQIKNHASALLTWLAGTAKLARNGERDLAVARVGKKTVEPVKHELDEFLATAVRETAVRQGQVTAAERRTMWLIGGGTLIAFLAMGVFALVFSRDFASRLSTLAENARRLAARQPLKPPLTGDDEIGRVDRAFHDMSKVLLAAAEQERQHRAQLSRKALEIFGVNRELQHRNEENELFIYSVSHDLRSPLVNLQGFSHELRRTCEELGGMLEEPDVPPSVRERMRTLLANDMTEAIHFISTAVSRLGTIIDALLRLSRLGRVEYRPQEVDVLAVVTRVVDSLQSTIAERGITVAVAPLPPCWGDPAAIEQVFANLFDNAVKYLDRTRAGSVEIGNEPTPDEPVSGQPLQTYYVRDNGLGIAEADQAKVFLPFQRAHSIREGEGIGLAVIRRIVERHGGRVWLESVPGKGSTFFVSFPTRSEQTMTTDDTSEEAA